MNIGEKIRKLRLQKGLSQENLAEMLQMSLTGYANIEQNKVPNLSLKRLEQIAQALEISLQDLLVMGENNNFSVYHNSSYKGKYYQTFNNYENLQKIEKLEMENQFLKEKITHLEHIIQLLKAGNKLS